MSSTPWLSPGLGIFSRFPIEYPETSLTPEKNGTTLIFNDKTSSPIATLQELRETSTMELHRLMSWYLEHCELFIPLPDSGELQRLHHRWISDHTSISASGMVLLVTSYFAAARSIEFCSPSTGLTTPSSTWRCLAIQLLKQHGYPQQATLSHIHAAIMLASTSIMERSDGPDLGPVAVVVRVAQLARIHQDPCNLDAAPAVLQYRRLLFWHVHGLDVGFALAHGLPPLISPLGFDVQEVDIDEGPASVFLATRTRANLLLAQILDEIYGPRPVSCQTFGMLDQHATQFQAYAHELASQYETQTNGQYQFVALALRMIACKIVYVLHKPYLRAKSWPEYSRYQVSFLQFPA